MDKLPTDVVLLIFSKLQVKTLLGLKCVCKSWSRIIDSPDLAKIHLKGGIEEPRLFIILSKSNNAFDKRYINNWKEDEISILEISSELISKDTTLPKVYTFEGSCNGILCFKRYGRAYLLNPFRQEALELPTTPISGVIISYGLGFDSGKSRYKIIRVLSQRCENQETRQLYFNTTCEIYTFGSSSSWRTLAPSSGPLCPVAGQSISLGGILYWAGIFEFMDPNYSKNFKDRTSKIVSFDVAEEEFRLISCPAGLFVSFHVVDLGGVLGVVNCSSSTHIEIWRLRNYEKENWVKEYRIQIEAPHPFYSHNLGTEVIGLWKNGEVLLKHWDHSFFSYNPKTDKLEFIQKIPSVNWDSEFCSFTGSLVSLSNFKTS